MAGADIDPVTVLSPPFIEDAGMINGQVGAMIGIKDKFGRVLEPDSPDQDMPAVDEV